jgi:hypothetical protein
MPDVDYILGHSPAEIRRLILQAGILKPITERLLREAGVAHMWEQVMRLFAVVPPIIKREIKRYRKELHQMIDALSFSARDWVEFDTSGYDDAIEEDEHDVATGQ